MGDKGKRDKGKREEQKKSQSTLKEKRKLKRQQSQAKSIFEEDKTRPISKN